MEVDENIEGTKEIEIEKFSYLLIISIQLNKLNLKKNQKNIDFVVYM